MRWERAQALMLLNPQGAVVQSVEDNSFRVLSSAGGRYRVTLKYDGVLLCAAHCACPDWGQEHLHDVPVCKHVLAACIYCRWHGITVQ